MHRNWLRFDPTTLLATLLVGFLPAALLLAISFISVTRMTLPLMTLLQEPHRRRVRDRCNLLDRELQARLDRMRVALQDALAPGTDGSGPPEALESITRLRWYPGPDHRDTAPPLRGAEAEQAEAILEALNHENDSARRRTALEALQELPVTVEDPVGFSYALEAGLLLDHTPAGADQLAVLEHARAIDPATVEALSASLGGSWSSPGLPRSIEREAGMPPILAGTAGLARDDSSLLLVATSNPGGGTIVATLPAAPFIDAALGALAKRAAPPPGIFFRIEERGDAATTVSPSAQAEDSGGGRTWATWPLPPPFGKRWLLATGTIHEESPNLLESLRRLRGIHYLWTGAVVLALGTLASLFLAGVVARRVQQSRAKDDFLRMVSHELRTPTASISMLAETLSLERYRSDEDKRCLLRQLETETTRLAALVEQVLEYGRLERGRRLALEVIVDPVELVQEAVAMFREREEGNDDAGEINVRSTQHFHPVLLDRHAIIGVVLNLLSNARKFSDPGAPIEVTVGEESRHLYIRVRDRGIGIRRRDLKRVFRPFFRGPTAVRSPGFGLGLAYCRVVARAHKGRMLVESTPGEGTTFTLEIPGNGKPRFRPERT